MKKILPILLLFCIPFMMVAQKNVSVLTGEGETEENKGDDLKVMVIPFHPIKYYFSDCDKALAKRSELNIQDVRYGFLAGLDYASENWVDKKHESMNLYQMKDSASKEILKEFYDKVSYSYDAPTRAVNKSQKKFIKKVWEARQTSKAKKQRETLGAEECYTEVNAEEDRYMKATIRDTAFLSMMTDLYQPDYYITINQFEVITDLEKCIDRELGNYRRRLKVHYNVFTRDGKLVFGDVVSAKYNSTTNDINKVIQDNFGFLGEYIARSLP